MESNIIQIVSTFKNLKPGFNFVILLYTNTKTPFSIEQDLILCNFFFNQILRNTKIGSKFHTQNLT